MDELRKLSRGSLGRRVLERPEVVDDLRGVCCRRPKDLDKSYVEA